MQAVPLQHSRMSKLHTTGAKIYIKDGMEILTGEEKRQILLIKQSEDANNKCSMCDNQPDCIVVSDASSMIMGSNPNSIKI